MQTTVYSVMEHRMTGCKHLGEYETTSREAAKDAAVKEHYPEEREQRMIDAIKYGFEVKYVSGYKDETKIARCVQCAGEFSEIEMEGATACPGCGTKAIPCTIKEDVTVEINWHELRILTIWAENWARKIQNDDPKNDGSLLTIMSIAGRLQRQHPEKTALTLFSEIRNLRKDYNIETDIDNDEHLKL